MNQQQQLLRLINMRNAVLQRQAAIDSHNAAVRERNLAEKQSQQQQAQQQQQYEQNKNLQQQLDVIEQFNDPNNTDQIEYYINYLQNVYEQQSESFLLEQIEEDLQINEREKVQQLLSK